MTKEYPFLFTNRKSRFYRHSDGRQVQSLREAHPEPRVLIHPQTVEKLDKEDDWVYIETERGRIKQKVK